MSADVIGASGQGGYYPQQPQQSYQGGPGYQGQPGPYQQPYPGPGYAPQPPPQTVYVFVSFVCQINRSLKVL